MTLERFKDALEVFNELTHLVPKEAPIHIMIGKIYKKQGCNDLALQSFNKALDLDPKDTNMVKTLIDKLDQENADMSEEQDLMI
jgi:anaphase-promoting complex subunit 3